MFCPKCNGIQDVITFQEEKDIFKARLCDVQRLKRGHIVYYQTYDFGSTLNVVVTRTEEDKE